MTENNFAAQAGDEPMRAAFFAWFAEHGAGHQYKESQDAFCAGYQLSQRATADVEQLVLDLSKWTGEGGMTMANDFVGRAKAILATTKPGA